MARRAISASPGLASSGWRAAGAVLQTSQPIGTGFVRSLRFRNDTALPVDDPARAGEQQRLHDRTATRPTAYRIRVYDTTLAAPRFSNSNGQVTFLIVQNRGASSVSATAWYW